MLRVVHRWDGSLCTVTHFAPVRPTTHRQAAREPDCRAASQASKIKALALPAPHHPGLRAAGILLS